MGFGTYVVGRVKRELPFLPQLGRFLDLLLGLGQDGSLDSVSKSREVRRLHLSRTRESFVDIDTTTVFNGEGLSARRPPSLRCGMGPVTRDMNIQFHRVGQTAAHITPRA